MGFMSRYTYHGSYARVETTRGDYIVPWNHCPDPTREELAQYAPEGIGIIDADDITSVENHTGWYGRYSADGYLDCTDWETADSEEELAEMLDDLYGDFDDDDEGDPDGVPNLDAMDADDLREWAADAPLSLPEPARGMLITYANTKADAMDQRLAGRILRAARLEIQCDALYQRLPDEFRW